MKVTMCSDDSPDVFVEAAGTCNLARLDQHIRTLQIARAWLKNEMDRRKPAQAVAIKPLEAVKK